MKVETLPTLEIIKHSKKRNKRRKNEIQSFYISMKLIESMKWTVVLVRCCAKHVSFTIWAIRCRQPTPDTTKTAKIHCDFALFRFVYAGKKMRFVFKNCDSIRWNFRLNINVWPFCLTMGLQFNTHAAFWLIQFCVGLAVLAFLFAFFSLEKEKSIFAIKAFNY